MSKQFQCLFVSGVAIPGFDRIVKLWAIVRSSVMWLFSLKRTSKFPFAISFISKSPNRNNLKIRAILKAFTQTADMNIQRMGIQVLLQASHGIRYR